MPRRVQRTRPRIKGQQGMPPGARYVGRGTRYGNPSRIISAPHGGWVVAHENGGTVGTFASKREAARFAVDAYRAHLAAHPEIVEAARRELAGRDLACWCKPTDPYCHVDVLLEALAAEPAA